jgi:hypothetical protein
VRVRVSERLEPYLENAAVAAERGAQVVDQLAPHELISLKLGAGCVQLRRLGHVAMRTT